ncbi:MAG: peptidylprolyl isomerase [Muribaculaceae bacterium]|nr:peptidylprolyl isomerase [Muribaculaceae bacterium]
METIAPGKYFEIAYKLFRVNPDGTETLVHEVTPDDPDRAIYGLTLGFVEALEEQLAGKEKGYKFDFVADPDKAFGPYSEDEIYTIPRDRMTVDGKFDPDMFTPGAVIPLMTPDNYRIDGVVVELTPEAVVLDLNHPLAKDKVHYIGEVIAVRDPKPEELQEAQPSCGCGCCGCGDNGCGCEGDDSSCGCDRGGCCGC